MINPQHKLSLRKQCGYLGLNRSYIHYEPCSQADDTSLANMIADIYRRFPVYGYRRITHQIQALYGLKVNHKKVLRMMQIMGIQAIYPKPCTSRKNHEHRVFPYLLKGYEITHPHQVWQTDITYIRTPHGFMYLNAFIDVFSRVVVGWCLSNTLDTTSCLRALEQAILSFGLPYMINTDQGCQYTSHEWVGFLQSQNIFISMNGAGRSNDNAYVERLWRTIKYEGFVLYPFNTVVELKESIRQTLHWYNHQRPHSSLDGQTPFGAMQQNTTKKEKSTPTLDGGIISTRQEKALYV